VSPDLSQDRKLRRWENLLATLAAKTHPRLNRGALGRAVEV
jgi:hypothetical protein